MLLNAYLPGQGILPHQVRVCLIEMFVISMLELTSCLMRMPFGHTVESRQLQAAV